MTTSTKPKNSAASNKSQSKTDTIITLMSRKMGASLDEMIEVTGWLPHTTHAALSGLRKKGTIIIRTKDGGVSRYTIAKQAA